MRKFMLAALAVFAISAAAAVPLTVSWAEGKVEFQKGSAWKVLNAGDKVESTDTIRLGPASYVELSDGRRKIVLSAPGVFALEAVLKSGAEKAAKTTGALGKLGKLVDPKAQSSSTAVAGVRGAAQGADSMVWATDSESPEALIEEARAMLREERFADAAELFGEAASVAEGELRDSALYSRAWCLASAGGTLGAIKTLRAMPAVGPWSGPRALLLARLDLDTGAAAEAKSVLQAALAAGTLSGDDAVLAKAMLEEVR